MANETIFSLILIGGILVFAGGMAFGAKLMKYQLLSCMRELPHFFVRDWLQHFGESKDKQII
jgi:hypothetical protein